MTAHTHKLKELKSKYKAKILEHASRNGGMENLSILIGREKSYLSKTLKRNTSLVTLAKVLDVIERKKIDTNGKKRKVKAGDKT